MIFSTGALAEFLSGANLLQVLKTKPELAIGYIVGVHDSGNGLHHCAGNTVKLDEVLELSHQYLESLTAENLGKYSADVILSVVYKKTWPCVPKNAI